MDRAKLRKLSRTTIQSIAKRELVRAVGKTEDIIGRLLQKYPGGVPIPDDSNASSSVKKRNVSERASKSRSSILNRPQGGAPHEEPLPVPQDAEAATGSCPINQSCEPKDSTEADEAKCDARVENGPDEYMVVDALREFTGLVNNVPVMWERIREAQHILDQTASLVDQMMPDLRETCLVREKLEVLLLSKMKKKPELWDGTAQLNKKDRKFRMEWLRSERKDETVKKWREDNEAFERNGRSPEPYENYASESEGEVIESLQTTPRSSTNGSPKRRTEEDLGDQRKRHRSRE